MIPIQATAKARRHFKMRGWGLAMQGRPRLSEKQSVQLAVAGGSDGEGFVRHKLPSKKRKTGASHSLSEAVASNKRAAKKH